MVGKTISHYKILAKLGEGGMGVVYKAEDTRLHRRVALKFFRSEAVESEELNTRFLHEAQAAAALDHPNICTVYEIDEAEGQTFLAMAYVEGVSVSQKIKQRPLKLDEALDIAIQAGEGLRAAHEKEIVHRDIKSSNLMLTPQGRVQVMDFGLARLGDRSRLTKTGITLGTPAYMSPEQAQRQPLDRRSDIWSLGVVIYEMVTGRLPFEGEREEAVLYSIINEVHEPITALRVRVPTELDRIVGKAMAKDPDERYAHIDDLLVDLRTLRKSLLKGLDRQRDRALGRAAPTPIESIAVLPLENLSGDPAQEYFADGMTDALITDLSKIGTLKVISRTSAMRYKRTEKPLPEIARELNVDAVVEGSVVREAGWVRITTQLIEAATDQHLWAERYERELTSILVLQSEVARAIAQEIKVKLTPQDETRLSGARPVNPEAYEAYLNGRYHWYKLSAEHLDTALEYFQLALEKDPNYALAYAGTAYVWLSRGDCGLVPPSEAFPRGKAAVLKALEMDNTVAEVHEILANVRFNCEWDWGGAEAEFQRALELNPNFARLRFMYSDFLISMRRPEEAMGQIERALELDPLNFFTRCFFGWHLVYLHRHDEAIAQLRKTLRTESNFPAVHLGLWGAFHQKGMFQEALAEAKKFFVLLGDSEVAQTLARGYTEAGYPGAMGLAGEKLAARSKLTHIPAVRIARMYAHAEEKDRALEWLEKAYDRRESPLVHLSVGWDWDSLRSEPRFQDLLRRMNLPQ